MAVWFIPVLTLQAFRLLYGSLPESVQDAVDKAAEQAFKAGTEAGIKIAAKTIEFNVAMVAGPATGKIAGELFGSLGKKGLEAFLNIVTAPPSGSLPEARELLQSFQGAKSLFEEGDFHTAEFLFGRLTEWEPGNALYWYYRAEAQAKDLSDIWPVWGSLNRERLDKAVFHYDRAISINPSEARFFVGRARANLKLNEFWDEADLDAWKRVVRGPHSIRRFGEAIVDLGRAAALEPGEEEYVRLRGEAFKALEQARFSVGTKEVKLILQSSDRLEGRNQEVEVNDVLLWRRGYHPKLVEPGLYVLLSVGPPYDIVLLGGDFDKSRFMQGSEVIRLTRDELNLERAGLQVRTFP